MGTERLCARLLLHRLQEGTRVQNNHGKVVHVMSPSCCCQVEMERLRKEEEAASVAREREELEQRVRSLEQQLAGKQNEMQTLQVRSSRITAEDEQGLHWQHKLFYRIYT